MNFKDKSVLITGGCSGIGKIMARKSLERGASKIIILDINAEAFNALKTEWESFGKQLFTYQLDLANLEQIQEVAQKVKSEVGIPDVLINNAGVVTGKYFYEQKHSEIALAMDVNAKAMMHLTLEFLPEMMKRNSGSIANICSLAGLISNPKMSVYAASKWAAIGWSDSLRLEMKQLNKNIAVTSILPYYINTGMFDGVKSKLLPILKPEPASEKFMRTIEKGKAIYASPTPYWFVRLSQGIMPVKAFDWVMDKVFGVHDTMKEFKGRL